MCRFKTVVGFIKLEGSEHRRLDDSCIIRVSSKMNNNDRYIRRRRGGEKEEEETGE